MMPLELKFWMALVGILLFGVLMVFMLVLAS